MHAVQPAACLHPDCPRLLRAHAPVQVFMRPAYGRRLRTWREHVAHAAPLLVSPLAAADEPCLSDNSTLQLGTLWGSGVPFSAVLASEDGCVRRRAAAAMVPLLDALGFLLLRGGCFHADPHAGNLLLQARARAGAAVTSCHI